MNGDWRTYNFPGIYKLTNLSNGKGYVGQSQNIAQRIKTHQHVPDGPYLQNALNKHGWDAFEAELLERVDDLALLDAREAYWIDTLQTCNRQHGYNIHPGGRTTRGFKHTAETRAKMSAYAQNRPLETRERIAAMLRERNRQPCSPETRAKMSAAMRLRGGYPHTPESKAKLSAAHMGIGHTPETRAHLSASHLGVPHPHTPEQDAKIGAANRAHFYNLPSEMREQRIAILRERNKTLMTEDVRAKLRAIGLGKHLSEETKAKIGAKSKGHVVTEGMRERIQAALNGHEVATETRARISAARREHYGTNERDALIVDFITTHPQARECEIVQGTGIVRHNVKSSLKRLGWCRIYGQWQPASTV
jgi:group I intron endonuclease